MRRGSGRGAPDLLPLRLVPPRSSGGHRLGRLTQPGLLARVRFRARSRRGFGGGRCIAGCGDPVAAGLERSIAREAESPGGAPGRHCGAARPQDSAAGRARSPHRRSPERRRDPDRDRRPVESPLARWRGPRGCSRWSPRSGSAPAGALPVGSWAGGAIHRWRYEAAPPAVRHLRRPEPALNASTAHEAICNGFGGASARTTASTGRSATCHPLTGSHVPYVDLGRSCRTLSS